MALKRFEFPMHTFQTHYPETGIVVQFGNNYQFASAPSAPPMRTFILTFPLMKYFSEIDYTTGAVTIIKESDPSKTTTDPRINMALLEDFYLEHQLYKKFLYPHPVHGDMTVRFAKPLKIPKLRPDGDGATESFDVELVERPT